MDDILFRCSQVGKLMGVKGIGVTGQTVAVEAFVEQRYQRLKDDIRSKYLDKGIENEQHGIDLINRQTGATLKKNSDRTKNEYLIGECDILTDGTIVEIKSCWDIYTFYKALAKHDDDYEWQCRGYMELWDRNDAMLVYTLTCATDRQILTALEQEAYKYKQDLPDIRAMQIIINMIYDKDRFARFLQVAPVNIANREVKALAKTFVHIPEEERYKVYEFKREQSKTDLMYSRVKDARDFLTKKFSKA